MIGYQINKANSSKGDTEEMKSELKEKKPPDETNFGANKEKAGEGKKFESYMAKVLSYIVTEEKGDTEHTKAISMSGILINKAEYEMEWRKKKEQDETDFGANKEKAGKGKKFEKFETLGGKIRQEKKLPDETVFKGSKV
jgi:hypothetical protein